MRRALVILRGALMIPVALIFLPLLELPFRVAGFAWSVAKAGFLRGRDDAWRITNVALNWIDDAQRAIDAITRRRKS